MVLGAKPLYQGYGVAGGIRHVINVAIGNHPIGF